jgi:hypothetical protein
MWKGSMSESDRPTHAETEIPSSPLPGNDRPPERELDDDSAPVEDLPVADQMLSATPGPSPESAPAAAEEGRPAPTRRDPLRRLLPLGWTLVVALIAAAVAIIIALGRISSEVNRVACVERAQATYNTSLGSKANAAQAGLARLGLQVALRKCGT